jgi:predicted RNase H-like HicB family nuclease
MSESDTRIDAYLSAPYTRLLIPDSETGTYTARVLEFSGCIAEGDTPADAHANLEEAARDWLVAAIDLGQEIPEPAETLEYRGRVLVRFPKSLHRRAAEAAQRDATSLNQFIVSAVAEKVGASAATAALRESIQELVEHRHLVSVWLDSRTRVATAAQEKPDFVFLRGDIVHTTPWTVILDRSQLGGTPTIDVENDQNFLT